MVFTQKRVLVVEDDPTSRKYLEIALVKSGYSVDVAEDAFDAQAQLAAERIEDFSCVVTDYRMPHQSGLELLAWIKERDPNLSTILVTAEGEKKLVAESLRGGAIDFLDKPVDLSRLQMAVAKATEWTQQHRHMAKSDSAVKELGKAQLHMLSVEAHTSPGQVQVYSFPKHEAGGDFFSRFKPAADRILYLLTDVSGHDPQAAYISAYFQGVVRGMLARGASAEEIFPDFNRFLVEEWNQGESFRLNPKNMDVSVAACAISIDVGSQTATIFTHGTPAPIYFRSNGEVMAVGRTGGFPLGWFSELSQPGVTHSIADGGTFYLWTDGLEDLAEKEGISPLSLVSSILEARENGLPVACIESAKDDILLSVVPLLANAEKTGFRPLVYEKIHGDQEARIDQLQSYWERSLQFALPDLSETRMHDVLLSCRELLLNALKHGCGRDPEKYAFLQISYAPATRIIRVRVSDPGPGHNFDFKQHEQRDATELLDAHRGLLLVRHLASKMVLEQNGSCVVLDFEWDYPINAS